MHPLKPVLLPTCAAAEACLDASIEACPAAGLSCRNLKFDESPNYSYCRKLLREVFEQVPRGRETPHPPAHTPLEGVSSAFPVPLPQPFDLPRPLCLSLSTSPVPSALPPVQTPTPPPPPPLQKVLTLDYVYDWTAKPAETPAPAPAPARADPAGPPPEPDRPAALRSAHLAPRDDGSAAAGGGGGTPTRLQHSASGGHGVGGGWESRGVSSSAAAVRRDSAVDGSDGFGSPLVRSATGANGRSGSGLARTPVAAEQHPDSGRGAAGGAGGGKSDALHCKTQ
jgi:hypothetical protein